VYGKHKNSAIAEPLGHAGDKLGVEILPKKVQQMHRYIRRPGALIAALAIIVLLAAPAMALVGSGTSTLSNVATVAAPAGEQVGQTAATYPQQCCTEMVITTGASPPHFAFSVTYASATGSYEILANTGLTTTEVLTRAAPPGISTWSGLADTITASAAAGVIPPPLPLLTAANVSSTNSASQSPSTTIGITGTNPMYGQTVYTTAVTQAGSSGGLEAATKEGFDITAITGLATLGADSSLATSTSVGGLVSGGLYVLSG